MSSIDALRKKFHRRVCRESIFLKSSRTPSIADTSSKLSAEVSKDIFRAIGLPVSTSNIEGQTAGKNFELATMEFIEASIALLSHLRPAQWIYSVHNDISQFVQYAHLADLKSLVNNNKEALTALGDYVFNPDVVVARKPLSDNEINARQNLVRAGSYPKLSPLRGLNQAEEKPLLHASISCKLTLRSDRSQNARTEGLNLIRNRKGHTPHIAVVTAEPMPTRLASLAHGTGDIDCVYHFALDELVQAVKASKNEAALDSLLPLIDGKRLRDIADLPFDLVA
jgi:hypothetical protein